MKKILSVALGALLALTASAQAWQDALLFSGYEYGGTARSMGMGNALTAVGGDMGSLGINPAGSAVAGYSQMQLTSGISLSVAGATSADPDFAFGDKVKSNFTRLKVPSVGFVLGMDTGQRTGLRRITFGFVSNSTADYTSRMYASGVNSTNSYSGSLASRAAGYPLEAVSGYRENGQASGYTWWNLDEFDATQNLPWDVMTGYRSGVIGMVNNQYLGLTDWDKGGGKTGVLAPLWQKYGFQSKGFKHDMLVNVGLDYGDTFYVGANLGISMFNYSQGEYWYEMPDNPNTFPDIAFDENPHGRFQYLEGKQIFDAKGAGVYFKIGALWRPFAGLRLGAAIQTPTYTEVETRMAVYNRASVTGVRLYSSTSPDWLDSYMLRTPWRFNAGLAYTFGNVGLLSVDWEGANYGGCRFRKVDEDSLFYGQPQYILDANADVKDVLGWSHMLRAGLEINVTPAFALRAGYGLTTSGIHNYLDWDNGDLRVYPLSAEERAGLLKQQFSAGFGFKSGIYFVDFAFRYRTTPNQYFTPYQYYDYDSTAGTYAYTDKYVSDDPNYQLPEVTATYKRFDAVLTLGLRF